MKTHYPDGTPTVTFMLWGVAHFTLTLLFCPLAVLLYTIPPASLDPHMVATFFGIAGFVFFIHTLRIMCAHKP